MHITFIKKYTIYFYEHEQIALLMQLDLTLQSVLYQTETVLTFYWTSCSRWEMSL